MFGMGMTELLVILAAVEQLRDLTRKQESRFADLIRSVELPAAPEPPPATPVPRANTRRFTVA